MSNGNPTETGRWIRTQEMFDAWFEVETYSMVQDVYMDEAIE